MLAIVAALLQGTADAHSPATAIGRAVEAFGQGSVSYDPGSVVSDVEAGGFPAIAGDVSVAFMPAEAETEIVGGPNAVAAEVALEAGVDGTLVVIVGRELGAWSEDIGDERLAELVSEASATRQAASPAVAVESLVRSIQAEPTDFDPPWGWIAAGMLAVAVGALVALDRAIRRRP